ncbi:mCG1048394 [Mus musculus]|nr:mCG1048394 [Mus musculus]
MCLRDRKRGANTEAESLEEAGGLPVEAARNWLFVSLEAAWG